MSQDNSHRSTLTTNFHIEPLKQADSELGNRLTDRKITQSMYFTQNHAGMIPQYSNSVIYMVIYLDTVVDLDETPPYLTHGIVNPVCHPLSK